MLMNFTPFYRQNLKLAAPIVLAQGGQMLVSMSDTLMVGWTEKTELIASIAFVSAIYISLLVAMLGFSAASTTLVGQANGNRDRKRADLVFYNGLWLNLLLAFLITAAMFGLAPFLDNMGQPKPVVEACYSYYYFVAGTFIPFAIFCSFKFYVEGLENPAIGTYHSIFSNLVNLLLNYVFIFGKWGVPEMGLAGAGLATLIARVVQALGMAIHVYWVYNPKGVFQYRIIRHLIVLGIPISLQMLCEVLAFSLGSVMMGWLGENQLAAHQIVISIAGLTYLMATGIGGAATILNSNELGRKDFKKINMHSWASWHITLIFMSFTALLFVTLRNWLPLLFVKDVLVVAIASKLLVYAGLFQIFDGVQAVGQGILRGLADVKVPTLLAVVGYFFILLPSGYYLAFVMNWGAIGIWIGYLLGLAVVSTLLIFRYQWLLRHFERTWS
jgi:MATE family multidrug resistance protein